MNDLLWSFEGHANLAPCQGSADQTDNGAFLRPIYSIDRELEKLFHDVGGQTSHIAFIDGFANLIIDDDKLGMLSTKASHNSHSKHNISKSFGPVGNCINSVSTGILLPCHMKHHVKSSKDILTSSIMIIHGINNPNNLHFPATTIHGNQV